jgi:hypothetical protein
MALHSGNEYEKFVMEHLIIDIMETFDIKTKKEARKYLFNALAMNVVGCEIIQMVEHLLSEEEK